MISGIFTLKATMTNYDNIVGTYTRKYYINLKLKLPNVFIEPILHTAYVIYI